MAGEIENAILPNRDASLRRIAEEKSIELHGATLGSRPNTSVLTGADESLRVRDPNLAKCPRCSPPNR